MRKDLIIIGLIIGAIFFGIAAIAQETTAVSPTPGVPESIPTLEPPAVTPSPGAGVSPAAADVTPVPAITPPPERENEPSAVTSSSSLQWSEAGAPVFTIDKAVITAVQQNPDVLKA